MFNRLLRTALPLLLALLGAAAQAVTLSASSVGNMSERGRSFSSYLTVNWSDADPNVGLIAFDLSGVSGSSVGASLNLFQILGNANGAMYALYLNTSDWSSGVTSWSGLPTHDETPVATFTIEDGEKWVWRSVDVSTAVTQWLSGTKANYGFTLVRESTGSGAAYFAGRNAIAPTLDIMTTVAEPETWVLWLAGASVLTLRLQRRRQSRQT